MNAKTMEGLTGASASIHMVSTPMSIAKEAERKGDTEKMKRALGYAAGLVDQADQYSEKTSEGMNSSQNMGYDKSGETAELAAETGAAVNVSA